MSENYTLDYSDENDFSACVVIDRVVRLSRDWGNDITFIHLDTGEILSSKTSMRMLQARLELALERRNE